MNKSGRNFSRGIPRREANRTERLRECSFSASLFFFLRERVRRLVLTFVHSFVRLAFSEAQILMNAANKGDQSGGSRGMEIYLESRSSVCTVISERAFLHDGRVIYLMKIFAQSNQ